MALKLHREWEAHKGQLGIAEAIFYRGIKSAFLQCGRKFGKTEIAMYIQARLAHMFPGTPHYFIGPEQKQTREIVWAPQRFQRFVPREWLKDGTRGINNSEMRLNFKNGSFIKVDGSDNYESYRGPMYKSAVYEEFKDHRPEFRKAMRPNAAVLDGIDIYMGSPPEQDCDYLTIAREHELDPEKYFTRQPSWTNPHVPRKWLYDEMKGLYLRGEGDVWEREYAARYVKGGARRIFPMFNDKAVVKHDELMAKIKRDMKKLKWFWWADPAGATCFAVLFVAINPYTKQVYVLDEIYEKEQHEMTTRRLGERIIEKREELYYKEENWRQGYDEAATWFMNEWSANFPRQPGLEPSHKHLNDKLVGLSLMKDMMLQRKLWVSDRCKWFVWEIENYIKDKNGKIPKINDHLIDDFRYILGAEFYDIMLERETRTVRESEWRGYRMEHEIDFDTDLRELEEVNFELSV